MEAHKAGLQVLMSMDLTPTEGSDGSMVGTLWQQILTTLNCRQHKMDQRHRLWLVHSCAISRAHSQQQRFVHMEGKVAMPPGSATELCPGCKFRPTSVPGGAWGFIRFQRQCSNGGAAALSCMPSQLEAISAAHSTHPAEWCPIREGDGPPQQPGDGGSITCQVLSHSRAVPLPERVPAGMLELEQSCGSL